jgi:hypothetical protein
MKCPECGLHECADFEAEINNQRERTPMKWIHARKGIVEGEIVREEGEWVDIKLTGDQTLRTARGWDDCHDGDVVTVRKSFLREVPA